MLDRIDRDAAEAPGGVVAEPVRGKTVGGFVKVMAMITGSAQVVIR